YAAYARAVHVRVLASVVGREGLTEADRKFLDFGDKFESEFIKQESMRSLEAGMEIGWKLLRMLPATELYRLNDRQIEEYITLDAETETTA
ncbi:MAG: V-type ATP synthase subunit B, partial [Gammaproteobacteria bacterium]